MPVFDVGSERGVHFYAMQFIDGQTLAQVIADLRLQIADLKKDVSGIANSHQGSPLPAASAESICNLQSPICNPTKVTLSTETSITSREYFRTVARLGEQAAEALEHAHALGVVHRDVKPGNLLIDAHGKLWVTDFGLARLGADGGLTMTGDLVGTLRYMSPEQALAKHGLVDHRTDIYSLGATLYELLTLEPVLAGADRQELLRQIAFEEARPPRRLNRALPAELETILLKAMEKNPAERYATAQELADDLRCFLEDRPVLARRPSWRQVVQKWARRHRAAVAAVAAAAACLVVSLAAAVGSGAWLLGERAARQHEAEGKVLEALAAAEPGLRNGDPQDAALIGAVERAEAQLGSGVLGAELRRRSSNFGGTMTCWHSWSRPACKLLQAARRRGSILLAPTSSMRRHLQGTAWM